ncbi:MAG: septum formation initiator family protein [Oscillospiraceae bacterium]|nr:septum formation initiator family protein [Oscillospiraceae bacterium]
MKRSKPITKIIVLAMIIYACISLVSLRARIETGQKELDAVKQRVAEMEISNAVLEYQIEHFNDPDVIASIARSRLGLMLPGERIIGNGDVSQNGRSN